MSIPPEPATAALEALWQTLQARKSADPQSSYVARLYRDGLDTILKKVGEEAAETLIAAKGGDRAAVVHEIADLWFHSLVLAAHLDIPLADLAGEIARRAGRSGLEEKASRGRREEAGTDREERAASRREEREREHAGAAAHGGGGNGD